MFLPLSQVFAEWQSEDGCVMAGSGMLDGNLPVDFAWLGEREIDISDIRGLNGFMVGRAPRPQGKPLLLLSETPGFRADPADEADGVILEVGRYRRFQQLFRDGGGFLVAVAHRMVVGGTFMAHGLAASQRLVTSGSVIYGALPPSAAQAVLGEDKASGSAEGQSLRDALAMGLFTEILSPGELPVRLKTLLAPVSR